MPDREPRSRPASGMTSQPGQRLPSEPLFSERLSSEQKVRRRADYLRCYRTGRRRQGSLALLYFVPNQLEGPRLGITASRKVGNAVIRHRLKRRINEIYRRWQDRSQLPPLDLVVHLKPEAGKSDFPALRTEVLRLLSGLRERRGPAA
jgi:ribonuclease P protein component